MDRDRSPTELPLFLGGFGPPTNTWFLMGAHPSPRPRRHVYLFSRHSTVKAGVERCCFRYSEVWPRSWSDAARPTKSNCTGSTFPTGFSSSWQWQLTSVWTAAHHRIRRSTASWSPGLTRGGIGVPPTVTYLPYRVSDSTLTAVGRSQLLARWPGTLLDFIRDPASSTDCFRRLLKTYLFARY